MSTQLVQHTDISQMNGCKQKPDLIGSGMIENKEYGLSVIEYFEIFEK